MPSGRRDEILAAARRLFGERGFHNVGMGDIGSAAGISGPGVYRHFASKEELLGAALHQASDIVWREAEQERRPGDDPLLAYVRGHVRFSVENTDLLSLWYQEAQSLPAESRVAQRRSQRRFIEKGVDALLARRPELNDIAARLMVRAAIGLIHSVRLADRLLDTETTEEVLVSMVMAALDAELPPGTRSLD